MNDVERRLIETHALPALHPVVRRVLDLCDRRHVDLIGLADAISAHCEIASPLLTLVGSSAYGPPVQLGSLRDAALYLGYPTLRSLALSFAYVQSMRSEHAEGADLPDDLWRASLASALAARQLAREVGGWDADEAFLAGLVADCGALLLYRFLPEYPAIVESFRAGQGDLLELERANLSTDHMRVGEHVLERWGFPESLTIVVGAHHDGSALSPDPSLELRVRILSTAWLCARAVTIPAFAPEVSRLDRRIAGILGLSVPVMRAILLELPDEIREVAPAFEIPASDQPSFRELLRHSPLEAAELARVRSPKDPPTYDRLLFSGLRKELAPSLLVDARTGLLTRESLETVLRAFHERARPARSSLGLLLVEIGELKARSQDAAAELLREARSRIEAQTRTSDVTGLFSDDQIAVVIPGCGRSHLEHVAERLRVALEGRPMRIESGEERVSVAIGVAGTSPHVDGLDAAALVRLACAALEHAQACPDRISVES
jgi:diguanylate cyclase (GGDEF)-like protein